MRIAIDFDWTIFDKENYRVMPGAKEKINKWSLGGHHITVFTAREDGDRRMIEDLLDREGVFYNRIVCGKIVYDILIDDKAEKFEGWEEEYGVH